MQLRQAQMKSESGEWFIWSINPEENTVSCLPYASTDEDSLFIWDLKHFPMSEVLNVDATH